MTFLILAIVEVSIYLLHGAVLNQLWEWFMVPILHLPAINLAQAIGIGIVVSLLVSKTDTDSDKKISYQISYLVSSAVVKALTALIVGWVAHYFV